MCLNMIIEHHYYTVESAPQQCHRNNLTYPCYKDLPIFGCAKMTANIPPSALRVTKPGANVLELDLAGKYSRPILLPVNKNNWGISAAEDHDLANEEHLRGEHYRTSSNNAIPLARDEPAVWFWATKSLNLLFTGGIIGREYLRARPSSERFIVYGV